MLWRDWLYLCTTEVKWWSRWLPALLVWKGKSGDCLFIWGTNKIPNNTSELTFSCDVIAIKYKNAFEYNIVEMTQGPMSYPMLYLTSLIGQADLSSL